MNNRSISNKNLYKIFLSVLKYVPTILAGFQIFGIILNYFNISSIILTCIGGVSLSFLAILYLLAIIFKYCYLYKMPLYYLTTVDIFFFISKSIHIEVLDIYRIHFIIAGIFILAYIIYAYLNRNKPKKDYIKELCERYCC